MTGSPDKVVGSPDKLTGTRDKVLVVDAASSKCDSSATEAVPTISVEGEVHRKEARDAVQDSKDAVHDTSTTSLSSNVSPPTSQQPAEGEKLTAEAAMAPADSAVEASIERDSVIGEGATADTPPMVGAGESVTADTAPLMVNGSPMEHGTALTVPDLD